MDGPRPVPCQPIVLCEAVLSAVLRRIPAVIRKTKLERFQGSSAELLQEFIVVSYELGLSRFSPAFIYGQYLTFLLYEAANRLLRRLRADRHVFIGLPEIEPTAQSEEDEAPVHTHLCDPLQTVERVKQVLGELSQKLQQTACQVWFDGQEIQAVAARQQVTANTINMRLHRTRQHLSNRMGIRLMLGARACRQTRRRRNGSRFNNN